MPELPEVETTRRGIAPALLNQAVAAVSIYHHGLRWPVPADLSLKLSGQRLEAITRRGKYLLFKFKAGTLLLHLGMSGSLRILPVTTTRLKHDHVDIIFANEKCLRFNDPRRFGAILWLEELPEQHFLLKHLGVEPLEKEFTAKYLWQQAQKRKTSIKQFIINHEIVVGVGNIYANEALFMARIHPQLAAGKVSLKQFQQLVLAIKKVLQAALKQGGTTLRDYVSSDGKPGYFVQQLKVYGRGHAACKRCKKTLREIRLGQRSTVYCPHCQIK